MEVLGRRRLRVGFYHDAVGGYGARYSDPTYLSWGFPTDAYAPLSFERPEPFNHVPEHTQVTDPIAGRQTCHLAPAEWRLLAWLEREGFGYDLYSEYQLHSGYPRTPSLRRYERIILRGSLKSSVGSR